MSRTVLNVPSVLCRPPTMNREPKSRNSLIASKLGVGESVPA